MILKQERIERAKPIRVESINTGRFWGFQNRSELQPFFLGRNKSFYRILIIE